MQKKQDDTPSIVKKAFDNSKVGMCIINEQGEFYEINEFFSEILGYSKNELTGSPVSICRDTGFPELMEDIKGRIEHINQATEEFEWKIEKRGGGYIDINTNGMFVEAPEMDSKYLFIWLKNISDYAKTRSLLNATQNSVKIGGWEHDLQDKTYIWTDQTYQIFDLAIGSKISLDKIMHFIVEDYQTPVKQALREAASDGKPFDLEIKLHTALNNVKWVRLTGQPEIVNSKIIKLSGAILDISEEKARELKRIKDEKKFRSLIQNSSDITSIISVDAQFKYVSPSFYRILGYKIDVTGTSVLKYIAPKDQKKVIKVLKEAKSHPGKNYAVDFRIVDNKGAYIHMEATGNYFNEENELNGFVVNARDVTDRKKAEQKLKDQNEQLKKINDELDSFVYSASHDLRAPLTSVLGLVELAQLEGDPDKMKTYLSWISKSINKLDHFIKDIVDYSRNSRVEIKNEIIDFETEVKEIFHDLGYMEGAEGIQKTVEVKQKEKFQGDINRTRVILNNLIANAIRYSNANRRKPFIKVKVVADSKDAKLTISDNGQGIPNKSLKRIFEMFYRASEYGSGSGLGLYIVKEALNKLQGTIDVTSTLGKGSTFTITIPSTIQLKESEALNPV